jgi:hypothetical protein
MGIQDRLGGYRSTLAQKAPCYVATTANITLSGFQTIDGVALTEDDPNLRVLVKNQTDTTQNGLYVASAGLWQRAPEFNGNNDVVKGTRVNVHSGSTQSGQYVLTTADPIVFGTSSITFSDALAIDYPETFLTEVYAEDFGTMVMGDQTAAAANVAAIHAARDYLIANLGMGTVVLPRGIIYINQSIVIRTNVGYRGQGPHQTIIRLADGSDCDVMQTINFDTYSMERTNAASKTATTRFFVSDMTLDGASATNSLGALDQGNGLSIFGLAYTITNLVVRNCAALGFYAEYAGSVTTATPGFDAGFAPYFDNITITNCDGGGWCYRGPSDYIVGKLVVQVCGVPGVSSESGTSIIDKGRGVTFESGTYPTHGTAYVGAGQFDQIHTYGNEGLNFYSNAWMRGNMLEAETGAGGNVKIVHTSTTEQTHINHIISYGGNRRNTAGSKSVEITGNRVSVGMCRIRLETPDLSGSPPYEPQVGLYISGQRMDIGVAVDGVLLSDCVATGIEIADSANTGCLHGWVKDITTVDGTNQAVNGSFGLKFGAIQDWHINLAVENCAVISRRASASSTNNFININGFINLAPTTGQLGLTGNWGLDDKDIGEVVYNDNGTRTYLRTSNVFLGSGGFVDFNSNDLRLTHSANTLTLTGGTLVLPASGLQVGSSNPFSDSAGTLTLQNVDALDATTEGTIEAAIDTLANLTSVQGHTVTLTGALIRSGAHSLTLTTTNTTSLTLPTSGTLATLAGAEALTNKTNVAINTSSTTYPLAVQDGTIAVLMGADSSATTLTNATNKSGRMAVPHYTNSEEPVGLFLITAQSAASSMAIGGGSSLVNAITLGSLYAATNNTTTTGTEQVRWTNGAFYFPAVGTTASAANAFLDSGSSPANQLLRSTSSGRYKRDVEDIDPAHADAVLQLRPVWYRSKVAHDPQDWSWYGLIAEEVAEIDPRLVHWGYCDEDWEDYEDEEAVTVSATERRPVLQEDGSTLDVEVPVTRKETRPVARRRLKAGAVKVPDGVQYERLGVLLLDSHRRLIKRVAALEKRRPT